MVSQAKSTPDISQSASRQAAKQTTKKEKSLLYICNYIIYCCRLVEGQSINMLISIRVHRTYSFKLVNHRSRRQELSKTKVEFCIGQPMTSAFSEQEVTHKLEVKTLFLSRKFESELNLINKKRSEQISKAQ